MTGAVIALCASPVLHAQSTEFQGTFVKHVVEMWEHPEDPDDGVAPLVLTSNEAIVDLPLRESGGDATVSASAVLEIKTPMELPAAPAWNGSTNSIAYPFVVFPAAVPLTARLTMRFASTSPPDHYLKGSGATGSYTFNSNGGNPWHEPIYFPGENRNLPGQQIEMTLGGDVSTKGIIQHLGDWSPADKLVFTNAFRIEERQAGIPGLPFR